MTCNTVPVIYTQLFCTTLFNTLDIILPHLLLSRKTGIYIFVEVCYGECGRKPQSWCSNDACAITSICTM